MTEPLVTIVVVPRERFSYALPSLDSIYEHTSSPFKLVYVDAGSPAHVARSLEAKARQYGFSLIRTDHYLSENQARNLGFREVTTRYVVFMDNDVVVTPGWLDALVVCAEETAAWIVGPVVLIGPPEDQTIHFAGGDAHFEENDGHSDLVERHRHVNKRLDDIRDQLQREICELAEFHCMLVRTEVVDRLGPLDEALWTSPEHVDFCLTVVRAGGTIFFEPHSVVAYVVPPSLAWTDVPFFMLRWSERWKTLSMEHFSRKWHLPKEGQFVTVHSAWLTIHRQSVIRPAMMLMRRVLGWQWGGQLTRAVEIALNRFIVLLVIPLFGRHSSEANR
jgi:GT2 family glycosyltransferase